MCPIKDENGDIDEQAMKDLIEVGGHLKEAGRYKYPAWKDAMKQAVGDVMNEGDFQYLWQHVRNEAKSRTGINQGAGGNSGVFVEGLTKKMDGLKPATKAVNEIVKRTGSTDIIDRYVTGKSTDADNRVIADAVLNNMPKPKHPNPNASLKTLNDTIAEVKAAAKANAPAKEPGVEASATGAGRRETLGGYELPTDTYGYTREDIEGQQPPTERQLSEPKPKAPADASMEGFHDKPVGGYEVNEPSQDTAIRKLLKPDEPPTAKTDDEQFMSRVIRPGLGVDGAEQWRGIVGEGVFNRLVTDTATPLERSMAASAYNRVVAAKPKPKPGAPAPGAQSFGTALKAHRAAVAIEQRVANSPDAATLLMNRRIGLKRIEALRAALPGADDILGKISRGEDLTPAEHNALGRAWLQVDRPPPTPAERTAVGNVLMSVKADAKTAAVRERNSDMIARFHYDKGIVTDRVLKMVDPKRIPQFNADIAKVPEGDINRLAMVYQKYERLSMENLPQPVRAFARGGRAVKDAFGFGNNFLVTGDFGMVGRHANLVAMANPDIAIKNLFSKSTAKAMGTQEGAYAMEAAQYSRPNYPLYEKGDVQLTSVDPLSDLHKAPKPLTPQEQAVANKYMEENTGAPWLISMPKAIGGGVERGIERAQVVVLNNMRMDEFDRLYKITKFFKGGRELSDAELKTIGNATNVFTGRGDPAMFGEKVEHLFKILWSPRLQSSRVETLLGRPMWNAAVHTRSLPATAAIASQYLGYLTTGGLVVAAAMRLGATIEKDTTSTNYLKLVFHQKRGDMVIDPFGGHQQYIVASLRMALGRSKSMSGKVQDLRAGKFGVPKPTDIGVRLVRSKMSPTVSTASAIDDQEDSLGRPVSLLGTDKQSYQDGIVPNLVTPFTLRDMIDAGRNEGMGDAVVIGLLNMVGVNANYMQPNQNHKSSASKTMGGEKRYKF